MQVRLKYSLMDLSNNSRLDVNSSCGANSSSVLESNAASRNISKIYLIQSLPCPTLKLLAFQID